MEIVTIFHVAGLHYLTDIDVEQNKRSLVHFYDEILNGSIQEDYFKRSVYYDSIQDRVNIDKRSGKPLDYSDGQIQFTLLVSTRREISTDTITELFRHPNYKE